MTAAIHGGIVVAPFLISQCYNSDTTEVATGNVVAPFLISQCYNPFLNQ